MSDEDIEYEYPPEWTPRGMDTPIRKPDLTDPVELLKSGRLNSGCPNPRANEPPPDEYPAHWKTG